METCVLIPPEFSLVLTTTTGVDGRRRSANVNAGEIGVRVFANKRIQRGTKFYPFQGTIRLDKIEVYNYLDDSDVRHRFGCYDEIQVANKRRVRHCNWIRFLRFSKTHSPRVNVLGSRVKGEPVFETTNSIGPNAEIVAYFLTEDGHNNNNNNINDSFLMASAERLALCTYREAMGMLIEHSPLDLSTSLLSSSFMIMPSSDTEDSSSPIRDISPITAQANAYSPLPIRRNRERTLLPCEVCGKAFDRPSLLKRHMRTHTGEKPHVCDVCGKGFSTSSSLNTHRRIHSGEKPHQCSVCGKRFTASSNLYYHRMTHNKEKPHKCNMCSKSFPTPGDLKSHMYVHSGSWPFKCHICNRGFSKQTNLKNHLFLHTGDKPHVCELCNKRFALACNLRAHTKTHEDDPQQECLKCNRSYLSSSNMLVHGYCGTCYLSNKGIPLIVTKSGDNVDDVVEKDELSLSSGDDMETELDTNSKFDTDTGSSQPANESWFPLSPDGDDEPHFSLSSKSSPTAVAIKENAT